MAPTDDPYATFSFLAPGPIYTPGFNDTIDSTQYQYDKEQTSLFIFLGVFVGSVSLVALTFTLVKCWGRLRAVYRKWCNKLFRRPTGPQSSQPGPQSTGEVELHDVPAATNDGTTEQPIEPSSTSSASSGAAIAASAAKVNDLLSAQQHSDAPAGEASRAPDAAVPRTDGAREQASPASEQAPAVPTRNPNRDSTGQPVYGSTSPGNSYLIGILRPRISRSSSRDNARSTSGPVLSGAYLPRPDVEIIVGQPVHE